MGVLAHALGCVECQPRDGDSEFLTDAHSCVVSQPRVGDSSCKVVESSYFRPDFRHRRS